MPMEFKVFWSWQDGLPKGVNKHFISDCLSSAVGRINKKRDSVVIPVVDRDTTGETGAPNIVSTIFSKIDDCHVFVGDVSIVKHWKQRSFPNPNVLIELGYAWNRLGLDNLILVINEAYGEVEKMPFNILQNRKIRYFLTENSEQSERDKTTKSMTEGFQNQIDKIYKRLAQNASILEFNGNYLCHTIEGQPIRNATISVAAKDYSTLKTKCEDGEMSWKGQIQISKTNPSSGQGEFTYTKGNGHAFGTHTIRRQPNGDISVFGVADFPHLHEFRVIWKKTLL